MLGGDEEGEDEVLQVAKTRKISREQFFKDGCWLGWSAVENSAGEGWWSQLGVILTHHETHVVSWKVW